MGHFIRDFVHVGLDQESILTPKKNGFTLTEPSQLSNHPIKLQHWIHYQRETALARPSGEFWQKPRIVGVSPAGGKRINLQVCSSSSPAFLLGAAFLMIKSTSLEIEPQFLMASWWFTLHFEGGGISPQKIDGPQVSSWSIWRQISVKSCGARPARSCGWFGADGEMLGAFPWWLMVINRWIIGSYWWLMVINRDSWRLMNQW